MLLDATILFARRRALISVRASVRACACSDNQLHVILVWMMLSADMRVVRVCVCVCVVGVQRFSAATRSVLSRIRHGEHAHRRARALALSHGTRNGRIVMLCN